MMVAPAIVPSIESMALQEKIDALTEENKLLWKSIDQLSGDLAEIRRRIKSIESQPKAAPTTAKIHERKMARVDALLTSHNNQPMTFADMGKMLGYSQGTRKQNMTHLSKYFQQYPERYEVRASKLGGKTVRLVPEYLNHLLKGGE